MWLLTADLGNSRAKLARWRGGSVESRLVIAAGAEDAAAARLSELAGEGGVAGLASVADAARTEALRAALESAGLRVHVGPPPGVENACAHPETTGVDRLYAARAAVDALGAGCVVVDCGTALTVDAVAPGEAGPRFLGGAIAPGPTLLARAVAAGGARLPGFEARPGDSALGRDTDAALRAGVAVGLRGAARALVEGVASEAGLGEAPVALTGGAREFLLEPAPFVAGPLHVDPDLVHRGLLAALRDALDVRD